MVLVLMVDFFRMWAFGFSLMGHFISFLSGFMLAVADECVHFDYYFARCFFYLSSVPSSTSLSPSSSVVLAVTGMYLSHFSSSYSLASLLLVFSIQFQFKSIQFNSIALKFNSIQFNSLQYQFNSIQLLLPLFIARVLCRGEGLLLMGRTYYGGNNWITPWVIFVLVLVLVLRFLSPDREKRKGNKRGKREKKEMRR